MQSVPGIAANIFFWDQYFIIFEQYLFSFSCIFNHLQSSSYKYMFVLRPSCTGTIKPLASSGCEIKASHWDHRLVLALDTISQGAPWSIHKHPNLPTWRSFYSRIKATLVWSPTWSYLEQEHAAKMPAAIEGTPVRKFCRALHTMPKGS